MIVYCSSHNRHVNTLSEGSVGLPVLNLAIRSNGVNFLCRFALQENNLMTARVSIFFKSRASPDMLPFSLCNKKRLAIRHMNKPLLSIPPYDIGKYVWLKTYKHSSYDCMQHNRDGSLNSSRCIILYLFSLLLLLRRQFAPHDFFFLKRH